MSELAVTWSFFPRKLFFFFRVTFIENPCYFKGFAKNPVSSSSACMTRKKKQKASATQAPLVEAFEVGNVFHAVPSGSLETLFGEIQSCMNLSRQLKETLAEQLMQRELLSSTGIGNGIAVPHPKKPLGQQLKKSMVGTFFLEKPLDFKAPDGVKIFVVFVLLSTDSFHHLLLLSQLARFLNNIEINDFLKHSPSLENLVDQFQKNLAETA